MLKFYSILLLIITASSFANSAYAPDIYENLNIEPATAGENFSGNTILGFIPFEFTEIKLLKQYFVSSSFRFTRGGTDFVGNNRQMESIDFLNHAFISYRTSKKIMPFITYFTPYKSIIDTGLEKEILKKRNTLSFGFLTFIDRTKQTVLTLDVNRSLYEEKDGETTSSHETYAVSARFSANIILDKKSSVFFGVLSPCFLKTKIGDNFSDSKTYFNDLELNLGLKYNSNNYSYIYSATYRSFDKYYDKDGDQINYPWVIEHRLIASKKMSKFVTAGLDYKLLPAVYYKEYLDGGKYRNSLGVFLNYRYNSIFWNFYFSDSRYISSEKLENTFFQVDIGFTF